MRWQRSKGCNEMLHYENLDERTRAFMLLELERDCANGALYLSPRLNEQGCGNYPALLREAILSYDDLWLAGRLRGDNLIRTYERRKNRQGGDIRVTVPHTAADTLAEGEFNRYFIRGLCARALADGIDEVQVYRGKAVKTPRPESESLIGTKKKAKSILDDLRVNPGVEPCLGLPPGPNSGLTVRL